MKKEVDDKMKHMFDVDIAKIYGVNAAVILENIGFWIAKNKANERNFFDGRYWTFNSAKAYSELFPYFSERQIRYILEKLEKDGLIITGNFNEKPYDRTTWYALTEKGEKLLMAPTLVYPSNKNVTSNLQNCQMDVTKLSDGCDKIVTSNLQNCQMDVTKLSDGCDKIVEPIPYINHISKHTDINENINGDTAPPLPAEKVETYAERFGERLGLVVTDWLKYKKERRENYKETGLKVLLNRIEREAQENGEEFVANLIEESISSGYKGIAWKAPPKAEPKQKHWNQFLDPDL